VRLALCPVAKRLALLAAVKAGTWPNPLAAYATSGPDLQALVRSVGSEACGLDAASWLDPAGTRAAPPAARNGGWYGLASLSMPQLVGVCRLLLRLLGEPGDGVSQPLPLPATAALLDAASAALAGTGVSSSAPGGGGGSGSSASAGGAQALAGALQLLGIADLRPPTAEAAAAVARLHSLAGMPPPAAAPTEDAGEGEGAGPPMEVDDGGEGSVGAASTSGAVGPGLKRKRAYLQLLQVGPSRVCRVAGAAARAACRHIVALAGRRVVAVPHALLAARRDGRRVLVAPRLRLAVPLQHAAHALLIQHLRGFEVRAIAARRPSARAHYKDGARSWGFLRGSWRSLLRKPWGSAEERCTPFFLHC
jgi:hypothetical protein